MQIIEPKIPFFDSRAGSIISFLIKLALWYILMGWTDGMPSNYYWLMLLPVMSAATSLGLIGLVAAVVLACGGYLSLFLFLPPGIISARRLAVFMMFEAILSDRRLSLL